MAGLCARNVAAEQKAQFEIRRNILGVFTKAVKTEAGKEPKQEAPTHSKEEKALLDLVRVCTPEF